MNNKYLLFISSYIFIKMQIPTHSHCKKVFNNEMIFHIMILLYLKIKFLKCRHSIHTFCIYEYSRALFLFQQIFSNSAYQPGGYQPPLGHKPSPNQQNHWYLSGGLLVASAPPGFIIMSGLG